MDEYRVKIKIRNNYLLTAMETAGYPSAASLARASGVSITAVCSYLNLTRTPVLRGGLFSNAIKKIAVTLNCLPEQLFPERHLRDPLKKNGTEICVSSRQIEQLIENNSYNDITPQEQIVFNSELRDGLDKSLKLLTPREEKVLRMRFFGDCTYREVANDFKISWPRIRQIESRALQKLRHPSKSRELRQYIG